MIRPWFFLVSTACFLAVILAASNRVPQGDPFAMATNERQVALDDSRIVAIGKWRHIVEQPRYDIGLFGNSRSLEVSQGDLGLAGNCRFFNYSLPGESIRTSVALLERLASVRRAPHVAVISVDNFELQFYSNPVLIELPARWRFAANDIAAGLSRPGISWFEFGRMTWRILRTEFNLAARQFNAELFREWLVLVLEGQSPSFERTSILGRGYRSDGSHTRATVAAGHALMPVNPATSRQILPGYLIYDLERLLRLRMAHPDLDIVLYESATAAIGDSTAARTSSIAAESRRIYLDTCQSLKLECHAAPDQLLGDKSDWADSSHAPPTALGHHIMSFLGGKPASCRV